MAGAAARCRAGALRVAGATLAVAMAVVTMAAVTLAGCTGGRQATSGSGASLHVLASTSLTEIMNQLRQAFETANPAIRVQVTVGADVELAAQAATQAAGGAATAGPADVLVVEGAQPLDALGPAASGPAVAVARNQMVIAVALGNPHRITRLADLTRPGLRVAVCAPREPCGALTATTLARAGVHLTAAAEVADVRAARDQVVRGAADAALVYRTDTRAAADQVDTVEFSESVQAVVTYQAAVLASSANAAAAQAFLAFLTSPLARDLLTQSGFQPVD